MQPLSPSELILRPNGAVYHLNMLPEELAPLVLTVGDPDRLPMVERYLDGVECRGGAREFQWVTGTLDPHRVTVLSTGIGTDNIDIVWNELDALVNIDLLTRFPKEEHTSLTLVRLGTSGSLQNDIPLGSILFSKRALGMDGLSGFYPPAPHAEPDLSLLLANHLGWPENDHLLSITRSGPRNCPEAIPGFTLTSPGFYAPQGRQLRLRPSNPDLLHRLADFNAGELRITNLEMETSGIFLLASLLGHEAYSFNAILANRMDGSFHPAPEKAVEEMIELALNWI